MESINLLEDPSLQQRQGTLKKQLSTSSVFFPFSPSLFKKRIPKRCNSHFIVTFIKRPVGRISWVSGIDIGGGFIFSPSFSLSLSLFVRGSDLTLTVFLPNRHFPGLQPLLRALPLPRSSFHNPRLESSGYRPCLSLAVSPFIFASAILILHRLPPPPPTTHSLSPGCSFPAPIVPSGTPRTAVKTREVEIFAGLSLSCMLAPPPPPPPPPPWQPPACCYLLTSARPCVYTHAHGGKAMPKLRSPWISVRWISPRRGYLYFPLMLKGVHSLATCVLGIFVETLN